MSTVEAGEPNPQPPEVGKTPEVDVPPGEPEAGATGGAGAERETRTPKLEKVFGQEVVQPQDLKAMSREIRGLLTKDDPDAALAAARQLAHLKRARVEVTNPETVSKVRATLQHHREHFNNAEPVEQAKYLTYLKYLGAIEEVSDREKERLKLASVAASQENRTNDLSELLMRNKYLGVDDKVTAGAQKQLQQDLQRKVKAADGEVRSAFALGRLKYLDVPHQLDEQTERQVHIAIDSKANQYAREKQWSRYARLRNVGDYGRGPRATPPPVQTGLAEQFDEYRKQAQQESKWDTFSSYLADVGGLSRRAERVNQEGAGAAEEEPADATVLEFLGELERSGEEYISPEERLRREMAQAQAERSSADREPEERAGERDQAARVEAAGPARESAREPVSAEQFPKRAAYQEQLREHERQVRGEAEAEADRDIFTLDEAQLKQRIEAVRQKVAARQEETGTETVKAREILDSLRAGGNLSPDYEAHMMEVLKEHPVDDKAREEKKQRYLKVWRNELGYGRAQQGGKLDKLISVRTERPVAQMAVAKGWRKLKALSPRMRDRHELWQDVIRARQDTVTTMREAMSDERVDEQTRAFLDQLADEFELINLRDMEVMQEQIKQAQVHADVNLVAQVRQMRQEEKTERGGDKERAA